MGASMGRIAVLAMLVAAGLLQGCSSTLNSKQHLAKVEPLFSTVTGEGLDKCLDDPRVLIAITSPSDPDADSVPDPLCYKFVVQLRKSRIQDYDGSGRSSRPEWQRNEIIDALLAVSNDKCSEYAAHLKTFDGQTNSSFSIASILLGGVGSIVTGADAARILSGGSAIVSGSRVALNDSWFSNQTVHVLVAAFEKARERQRREIKNRQACPIKTYPLMSGFGDAMKYHGSCSLLTGLAETALAVERSDQPGLDTMRRQLADLASIREQASNLINATFSNESARTRNAAGEKQRTGLRLDQIQDDLNRAEGDKLKREKELQAAAAVPGATALDVVTANDGEYLRLSNLVASLTKSLGNATSKDDAARAELDASSKIDQDQALVRLRASRELTQSAAETAVCPYTERGK
jgi:hypothetical protein